jgi:hypothetical protein
VTPPPTACARRLRLSPGLDATLFRAGPAVSDTLVVAHYPVGGNDRNTGPRFAREAALTGFDQLGITRVGTNTCRPDPRLRRRLAAGAFDELCARTATALLPVCRDYRVVILRGQSTGSFPTLGVVAAGVLPVTHLLVEDGINTRRSRGGGARGPLAARLDWLRYSRQEAAGMRRPPVAGWADPTGAPDPRRRLAWFLVEQYHWAPLWRSTYSRDALVRVVRERPGLPVLVKCLGRTALSTRAEVDALRRDLARVPRSAPCVVDLDPDAWHGQLVYAEYGAANLRAVRALDA